MPNGFHDSTLFELRVDYKTKKAELIFDVDVSIPGANEPSSSNRRCRLTLNELIFFVIEPPSSLENIKEGDGLWCDAGALEGERLSKIFSGKLSPEVSAYWFFCNETNSFFYVAAKDASFSWLE